MSIHRLHGLYRHSTEHEKHEGKWWYAKASLELRIIAESVGRSDSVTSGVAAALSPGTRWERCLLDTKALMTGYEDDQEIEDITVTTYNANKRKAWRILDCENPTKVLKGPKVIAFYDNLLGDERVPCIDSHAINAWHGERIIGTNLLAEVRVTTFRKIVADYIRAAKVYGLTAAQFQAIIWVSWKRRVEQGNVTGYVR